MLVKSVVEGTTTESDAYLMFSNLQIFVVDSEKPLVGSNIRLIAPDMHAEDRWTLNSKSSLEISVTYSLVAAMLARDLI